MWKLMFVIFILSLLWGCESKEIQTEEKEMPVIEVRNNRLIPLTPQEQEQIKEKCSKYPEFIDCVDVVKYEYEQTKYYVQSVNERKITKDIAYNMAIENEIVKR